MNALNDLNPIVEAHAHELSNGWLELLQAAAVDLSTLRIQKGVHNKGHIVDGALVALGSQDWSGDGVLRIGVLP